jgi:hypothetical protein
VVRISVWRWLPAVVAAIVAILALPAVAMADIEPNNGITEAEGPLAGGATYTGAVANSNDLDTYFFYVNGQQQIHILVTATSGDECLRARFGDSDNDYLAEKSFIEEGHTAEFTYSTPPGVNRYYLELASDCSGEARYSFVISPGGAVVGGASTLVPTPTGEPNENAEQASGPLLGGVAYAGEIQTQNDEDWLKFYTAPGTHQFDIAVTQMSGCEVEAELKSPVQNESRSDYLPNDEWGHFTQTSPAAGVYYLRFTEGCVGSRYEFVIEPPESLTTLAPPPPPPPPAPTPPPAKPRRGYVIANPTAKVEHGNAMLELTCAGAGDCAGTVSLVAHQPGHPTTKVVIGSGTFALPRGTDTVLPVAVSRLGMGMLHLSANGQVHVHLSGHDLKGGSLLLISTEGHRRKRHRHHHRAHHHHRHR